jgi:hypothetical protein
MNPMSDTIQMCLFRATVKKEFFSELLSAFGLSPGARVLDSGTSRASTVQTKVIARVRAPMAMKAYRLMHCRQYSLFCRKSPGKM